MRSRGGFFTRKLYTVNLAGDRLSDISDVLDSYVVDWDESRTGQTKMSCRLELNDTSTIRPMLDIVQPALQMEFDNGSTSDEPLGSFILDIPPESHLPYISTASATGRDLTNYLANSVLENVHNIGLGYTLKAVFNTLFVGSGLTNYDIRTSSRSTGIKRSYWPGRTRGEVASELATVWGWYEPFMERSGIVRTMPIRNFATVSPYATLGPDDIELDVITREAQIDNLANVIAVVKDVPDSAPIVAIVENRDPKSPMSIDNLGGKRYFRRIDSTDVETDADAESLATEELKKSSGLSWTLRIKVNPKFLPDAYRTVDLVGVVAKGVDLSGRYHVRGWSVTVAPDALSVELTCGVLVDLVTKRTT